VTLFERIIVMIKRFASGRPILFSVIVFIVNAVVAVLSVALFTSLFGLDMTSLEDTALDFSGLSVQILSKAVLSAVIILILVTLGMKSEIIPARKGIGIGLLLGWFVIGLAIVQFAFTFDFKNVGSVETNKFLLLLPLVVGTLLIGVSEEFLCRGIFYNVIFNKYRNVHVAVFVSSAIFGAGHLLNLIVGASLDETLLQVLYAFAFGVLVAAIYARCKNIWAVVLLHALFDFFGYAPEVLTPAYASKMALTDTNTMIIVVVASVVAICLGLFLIRKSWRAGAAVSADNAAQLVEDDELSASQTSPTT